MQIPGRKRRSYRLRTWLRHLSGLAAGVRRCFLHTFFHGRPFWRHLSIRNHHPPGGKEWTDRTLLKDTHAIRVLSLENVRTSEPLPTGSLNALEKYSEVARSSVMFSVDLYHEAFHRGFAANGEWVHYCTATKQSPAFLSWAAFGPDKPEDKPRKCHLIVHSCRNSDGNVPLK
ncbi:MAG: hypothetical protein JRJ85_05355 [Deltaproteobacteria bacterium]|nr:hypothetical protein [Deltaproteobacteria bacterium]